MAEYDAPGKDGAQVGKEPFWSVEAENPERVVRCKPQRQKRFGCCYTLAVVLEERPTAFHTVPLANCSTHTHTHIETWCREKLTPGSALSKVIMYLILLKQT